MPQCREVDFSRSAAAFILKERVHTQRYLTRVHGKPGLRDRSMDKKTKKKLDLANQKLQTLRQQLAGAKRQDDEPGEVQRLQAEIDAVMAEVAKLKGC